MWLRVSSFNAASVVLDRYGQVFPGLFRSVEMEMVPPSFTAARELFRRFRKTCCSCPLSEAMGGRSSARRRSNSMFRY